MRTRLSLSVPVVVLLVVAALVVGGAGTATAGGALNAGAVKKIVAKAITKAAPKLSVGHASTADSATTATTATKASTADLATKAGSVADNSITGSSVKDGSLTPADTGVYGVEVSSVGDLIASNVAGVTSALVTPGQYEVIFPRDMTKCFYSATPFNGALMPIVEPRVGKPNGVYVGLYNTSGAFASAQLYLTVVC
jgi:hypothetical protein